MKKMFVLSLAVAFSVNAFAAPKDEKAKDDAAARAERVRAAMGFRAAAKADPTSMAAAKSAKRSGLLDSLTPAQTHSVSEALKNDPSLRKKIADLDVVVKSGALTSAQAKVLATGIANVASIDAKYRDAKHPFAMPEDKAKQAYASLILGAGEMAKTNAKSSPKIAANFIEVAEIANDGASKDKYAEGMDAALKKLREITKNDKLTIDDLNKLCPPVA